MKIPLVIKPILIVLLVIGFAGCQVQKRKIEKANSDYDNYSFTPAIKIYEEMILKDPKNGTAEILSKLGNAYYFRANHPAAIKWYSMLFEKYPAEVHPIYFFRLARSLAHNGNYDKAERYMEDYLRYKDNSDSRASMYSVDKKSVRYNLEIRKNSKYFSPWPPPKPTLRAEIKKENFESCRYLSCVDNILSDRLAENDYELGYYYVPSIDMKSDTISDQDNHGFVLATRLEHINEEGFPKDPDRWITDPRNMELTFVEYISEIFVSRPGYFRVILFVITDHENVVSQQPISLSKSNAIEAVRQGKPSLPRGIGNVAYDPDLFKVFAFIYEYKVDGNSIGKQSPRKHSKVTARDHLKNSNIFFKY